MRSSSSSGPSARTRASLASLVLVLLGVLLLGSVPLAGATAVGSPSAPAHAAVTVATAAVGPANASDEGWYHLTVHSASPALRDDASETFDVKDGYVLLFGGCSKPVCPLLDTWKYQAGMWTNLTGGVGINPTARYGAAMVYDARDGYVVMFGGESATGALGDTWSFEYGRWTQVATTSSTAPSPRHDAGIIYDALDSEVILFGGESGTGAPLSDTWAFAGGVWTNLTASAGPAPPARFSAGFAYDSSTRMGVLFGGTGLCGSFCSDTWSFEAGHWTNLTTAAGTSVPSPRAEATLAYDPGRGELVLIGGEDGITLSDTWGFVHGAWLYLPANTSYAPGARANVAAVFDPPDGYLLTYGGHSSAGLRSGTWVFLTPLTLSVVPTLTMALTGEADQFTAPVAGGFGTVNVSWNFGDGSPVVAGTSSGHTYFSAGTYPVIATGTDALGVTVSASATITVELPPLAVAISASPDAPLVGQTVTLLAAASGGTAPYSYQWSGDVAGCSGLTMPTLSCAPAAAGTLQVSVTVVDQDLRSVASTASIPIAAGSTGLAGHGATASLGSPDPGLSTAFTSIYLSLAIFAACAVGVFTYRAGRRREAARNAIRPHCYAVPAWSETPADFSAGAAPPSAGETDEPSYLN
jgi:PKD domain-containing protein/galactose oxidase-like protein/SprB-like repeat protein